MTKRQKWLHDRHIYTGEPNVSSRLFRYQSEEAYFLDLEREAVEAIRANSSHSPHLAEEQV